MIELIGEFNGNSNDHYAMRSIFLSFIKKSALPESFNSVYRLYKKETDVERAYKIAEVLAVCADKKQIFMLENAILMRKSLRPYNGALDPLVPIFKRLTTLNARSASVKVLNYRHASNSFVRREAIRTVIALRSPKTSKALVESYTAGKWDIYDTGTIRRAFAAGYPAVVYNKKDKTASLDEAKLKTLLDAEEKALRETK